MAVFVDHLQGKLDDMKDGHAQLRVGWKLIPGGTQRLVSGSESASNSKICTSHGPKLLQHRFPGILIIELVYH